MLYAYHIRSLNLQQWALHVTRFSPSLTGVTTAKDYRSENRWAQKDIRDRPARKYPWWDLEQFTLLTYREADQL